MAYITSMTGSDCSRFCPNENGPSTTKICTLLPATWTAYSFHINYRNRLLFVEVAADQVAFTLLDGPAIPLTVYDQKYTLKDRLVLPIRKEEVHV